MKAASGGGESSSTGLHAKYPISSQWEFKLKNGDVVKGEIYCTDPVAEVVVIQDALKDIRMISLASISESKHVSEASADAQLALTTPGNNVVHAKKALEEREKRAVRIAQDSLKHLNPKVRPRIEDLSLCVTLLHVLLVLTLCSSLRHPPEDKPSLTFF